jgi:hypothetical protein
MKEIMKITKEFRVWGWSGDGSQHRQRESFCNSYNHDFSKDENVRIIEVLNSDKTFTNDYTIVKITRNTEKECFEELYGQLSDGIFENSRYGDVEVKIENTWKKLEISCI